MPLLQDRRHEHLAESLGSAKKLTRPNRDQAKAQKHRNAAAKGYLPRYFDVMASAFLSERGD
jgi:hypothetical protein